MEFVRRSAFRGLHAGDLHAGGLHAGSLRKSSAPSSTPRRVRRMTESALTSAMDVACQPARALGRGVRGEGDTGKAGQGCG